MSARRLGISAVAVLGAGTLPRPALAQGPIQGMINEVRRTSAAGEHARALALADSLLAMLPDQPTAVLVRAVALARAGARADAIDAVRRLLRWDPRYARRALEDSALAPLRAALHDLNVAGLAERADRPIARAHPWAVIAERDLIPEGTAYDPATRSVLVGSLNKYKIVAIGPDGRVSDRVPSERHGLRSVAGIHVDASRGVLWVTSNPRYDGPDTTTSRLFAFDAATGGFRSSYLAPTPGPHFFNDITTGRDGAVYLTDTQAREVLTLRPGGGQLEPFAPVGDVLAPNGITISTDGRHLFVADADHVQVVALDRALSWRLAVPDSFHLGGGIDGLAFAGDALIAHHPLAFWRISRYQLDPEHRRVIDREEIEANTPDSRTSTTGEVVDGAYVFFGNGQLDRMNNRTIDSATMDPVRMYRIALDRAPDGVVAVALSERDSVALFDAQTLDRVGTLAVGHNPHEIASSPDGRRAYVANARDTTITVLDVAGRRVVATWGLPGGISVHDVAVEDDGATVWAVSGEQQVALQVDALSGAVRRRFPLERAGSWMLEAGSPAGTIVIANLEGGAVTLLNPESGEQRVLESVVGEIDATASPNGGEVWSVNYQNGQLTAFDLQSGAILNRQPSGEQAARIVFTMDGRLALTVNSGDSTVVAIDVTTRRRVGRLSVAAGPKVIAVSRDGRRAYITHPERAALTMVDLPSLTVLRTIAVPGMPDGVAVLGEGIRR